MQISREKHYFQLKEKASAMVLKWMNAWHASETAGDQGGWSRKIKQAYGVVAQTAHNCSKGRRNTKAVSLGAPSKGKSLGSDF